MNRKQIQAAARKINREIYKLGSHFSGVPMQEIANICKSNGLIPVQEDLTEWSGIFCGSEGRATIYLADMDSWKGDPSDMTFPKIVDNMICISWLKLRTQYDVCTYIS